MMFSVFCPSAVHESPIVYDSGYSEMLMTNAINAKAIRTLGKEARAMESFANALQALPICIAGNARLNSAQLISELIATHVLGENNLSLG